MKNLKIIVLVVFALSFSKSLFAQTEVPLKDFLVYAKGSIYGNNGDFEGRTGAGHDIKFKNWMIKKFENKSSSYLNSELNHFGVFAGGEFSLESGSIIYESKGQWYRGAVEACLISVESDHLGNPSAFLPSTLQNDFCRHNTEILIDHSSLSNQVNTLSQSLSDLEKQDLVQKLSITKAMGDNSILVKGRGYGVNVYSIEASSLNQVDNIYFLGNHHETFVVNVRGSDNISLNGVGIYLRLPNGARDYTYAPTPGRIYFNFPDTQRLEIKSSGASPEERGKPTGIPFTIVASNADFHLNSALVTGAIYVKNYYGATNNQVNHVRLRGIKQLEPDCQCK